MDVHVCVAIESLPRCAVRAARALLLGLSLTGGTAVQATLLTPSVSAVIETNYASQDSSQFGEPVMLSLNGSDRSAGVWTQYGINRAGSVLALERGVTVTHAWLSATSRWTDALRLWVPEVAAGDPVRLRFSIGLDGHLEAHEDPFTMAKAQVNYAMGLNHHGTWIVQPSFGLLIGPPSLTGGGHVERDIDLVLLGELEVANGNWFNLISDLSVRTQGDLMGPPGSMWAESAFGNSARWLGGAVWVDGHQASSFTIMSGSGFSYLAPTGVPEPASAGLMLAGLGLLHGVGRWRRRARN